MHKTAYKGHEVLGSQIPKLILSKDPSIVKKLTSLRQAIMIILSVLSNLTSNIYYEGPLIHPIIPSSFLPILLFNIAFSISYTTIDYSSSIPTATSFFSSLDNASN